MLNPLTIWHKEVQTDKLKILKLGQILKQQGPKQIRRGPSWPWYMQADNVLLQ